MANPSADLYGSDRMVLEAVRGLTERGWRVVVAASTTGPLEPHLRAAGAELVVCPVPVVRKSNLSPVGLVRLLVAAVRGLPAMVRLVRRVRPDIVYVNTVTIPLWLVVARLLRVPSVVHVHEAEASVPKVARVGLSLPTRLADLVICNSAVSRDVTGVAGGPAGRMTVIHNGVPSSGDPRPPREVVDSVRLLYVGRVSPRKGVDVAVRALAALRDRGVDATLDVVGDVFPGYEWYERELRALVEHEGLGDSVRLHGFADDVFPHLRDSDIVIVPSRADESFGNGVVEAALSARPMVISDHTGLREASEGFEAVVRVPPERPDRVADAVVELLASWSDACERAVADSHRARVEYSPERYRSAVADAMSGVAARA